MPGQELTMFKFPKTKEYENFTKAEKEAYKIKERPLIDEFCEKNIELKAGYASKGKVKYRPWQRFIQNLPLYYKKTCYVLPVQMGKSFLADMICFYAMAILKLIGLLVYENKDKARSVFKLRLKPMVQMNKCLAEEYSGRDKDLTIELMQFNSYFWKVASAENRNDLATFPAPIAIVSEASKIDYKNLKYDVSSEISGRQESIPEHQRIQVWETSPNEKGDPMYKECFVPEAGFLRPHVPCPLCGEYQELRDTQIKLRKSGDEEPDHDVARIRREKEKAVYYECVYCKGEIKESDRRKIGEKVVWALFDLEEKVSENYTFKQKAQKILKDGTVLENENSRNMTIAVPNADRLINNNPKQAFYERLALYFEAKRDEKKWHVYLNNQRGWWYTPKKISYAFKNLDKKMITSKYTAFLEDSYIPNEVLILFCSIDTQDNGFFWLIEGFGAKCSRYVIAWGFVSCPINDEELNTGDYSKSLEILTSDIFKYDYKQKINNEDVYMPVHGGFIDRGGHRSELIDYICDNTNFKAYIGRTRNNPEDPIVDQSKKGDWYLGKTQELSKLTSDKLNSSNFYVPKIEDSSKELTEKKDMLLNQLPKQYHYIAVDSNGKEVEKWHHGGNDHLRDCMNMNEAYLRLLKLDTGLFSENVVSTLQSRKNIKVKFENVDNTKKENKEMEERPQRERRNRNNNGYFGRSRRF